jgi:hypothetical protein
MKMAAKLATGTAMNEDVTVLLQGRAHLSSSEQKNKNSNNECE